MTGRTMITPTASRSVSTNSTDGDLACNVATPQRAQSLQLNTRRTGKHVTVRVTGESSARWRLQLAGTKTANVQDDVRTFADPFGIILQPVQGSQAVRV